MYREIFQPYELTQNQVQIPRGASFSQINGILAKKKIVKSPRLFHYYARFQNAMTSLQAGHYTLPHEVSLAEILAILQEGSKDYIRVTIPEGKNIFEIGNILENHRLISESSLFIKEARKKPDESLGLPQDAQTLEGYLYPETYYFSPKTSVSEIIYTMILTFQEKTQGIARRKNNLSWHEIITLASIVEKETGVAKERPRIAGVFHNRLKKRMKLQSDPTTIYGIFERFDGNLRRKDLRENTPYNTYRIPRLPPGPICNPGIKAIQSILKPEKHSYLYFVSKNNGTHVFSKTYKEHKKAVNFYQKRRGRN